MSDEKRKPDYSVGYGKPPKRTQFKPGQSGNPTGRPRRRTTLTDDLEVVLNSKIDVKENGQSRKITKRRAIATQHAHKAMNGSIRSTKLILQCLGNGQSDPHNSLGELVEEFRNRDRRLQDRKGNEADESTEGQTDPKSEKPDGEI